MPAHATSLPFDSFVALVEELMSLSDSEFEARPPAHLLGCGVRLVTRPVAPARAEACRTSGAACGDDGAQAPRTTP